MSLYHGLRPLSLTRVLGTLLLSLVLVCLLDRIAYAQGAITVAPVAVLNPTSATIAILALIAGFLINAKNSGSVFGVATVPTAWLPYVGLIGGYLLNFVAYLQSVPTVNGAAWFNATLAGFLSLGGSTIGVTIHQHTQTGKKKPPQIPGVIQQPVVVPAAPPPTPPAAARIGGWALGILVMALGLLQSGCLSSAPIVPVTPANTAQVSSCENTATLHDGFVIGDFALGGAAAALGGTAAAVPSSNASAQEGLAISAAVAGAGAVVLTAFSEYTASNFANGNCPSVVGPLPAAAPAATVAK